MRDCNQRSNRTVTSVQGKQPFVQHKLEQAARLYHRGYYRRSLKTIRQIWREQDKLSRDILLRMKFLEGDVLHELRSFEEAIKCYSAILLLQKSDIAYANKALAQWELGLHAAALRNYLRAVKLNKNNAIAHRGVGEMLIKLGRPAKSVQYLTRSLDLQPDYAACHRALGVAFYQMGKWSTAHRHFTRCVELDSDDELARRGKARIESHFGLATSGSKAHKFTRVR